MAHLSEQNVVHRDLASRNVLLASGFVCKVADFGLSRHISAKDDNAEYYKCSGDTFLPIRWTAPEGLTDQRFSSASDVWSFGITCIEIFQDGNKPYNAEGSNIFIMQSVKEGSYHQKPTRCPANVYLKLVECWTFEAKQRPAFKQLAAFFSTVRSQTTDEDMDADSKRSVFATYKRLFRASIQSVMVSDYLKRSGSTTLARGSFARGGGAADVSGAMEATSSITTSSTSDTAGRVSPHYAIPEASCTDGRVSPHYAIPDAHELRENAPTYGQSAGTTLARVVGRTVRAAMDGLSGSTASDHEPNVDQDDLAASWERSAFFSAAHGSSPPSSPRRFPTLLEAASRPIWNNYAVVPSTFEEFAKGARNISNESEEMLGWRKPPDIISIYEPIGHATATPVHAPLGDGASSDSSAELPWPDVSEDCWLNQVRGTADVWRAKERAEAEARRIGAHEPTEGQDGLAASCERSPFFSAAHSSSPPSSPRRFSTLPLHETVPVTLPPVVRTSFEQAPPRPGDDYGLGSVKFADLVDCTAASVANRLVPINVNTLTAEVVFNTRAASVLGGDPHKEASECHYATPVPYLQVAQSDSSTGLGSALDVESPASVPRGSPNHSSVPVAPSLINVTLL